jgi:hypothetical protein
MVDECQGEGEGDLEEYVEEKDDEEEEQQDQQTTSSSKLVH